LEPHSLNLMIMTALENYNAPQEKAIEVQKFKDPIQKELDIECGKLLEQVVQIMPNSFAKKAMNFDTIKNIGAEKMGQIIRIQLSEKLSMQKIIDMALPSLEKTLKEMPISADEDAYEAEALKKIHAEELLLNKTKADMQATAHKAISELISNSVTQVKDKFFDFWNRGIKKVFGKHTNRVSSFFNWVGFRAVYSVTKWTVIIAASPIILAGWVAKKIFWAFMDSHIAKEVQRVFDSLQTPIHEDLVYKLTERVVKSLKGKSS
ncbi:MAG: hypothetical protein H0X29_07120, partial [Parachlamydiaceae bacterium]|nr:hypothetical protein [Parachlamydiaceae bacterium]